MMFKKPRFSYTLIFVCGFAWFSYGARKPISGWQAGSSLSARGIWYYFSFLENAFGNFRDLVATLFDIQDCLKLFLLHANSALFDAISV